MNKKELRKISLKFRTLSSQMLRLDSQEEINYIKMFFDFICKTPYIFEHITACHKQDYDFKKIFEEKRWGEMLVLPSSEEVVIDYCFQLLQYILDGPKFLPGISHGCSHHTKINDSISSFIRKAFEPFVTAINNYLELSLIDIDETPISNNSKTIFLSYCQKDSDIADLIDTHIGGQINSKAKIARDVRDVEFNESFKKFMQSIEKSDYVVMIISDNYLKSRNCMFEVLEVIKSSEYQKKLAFIVLSNEDEKYYSTSPNTPIGANVYTNEGQTSYSLFWGEKEKELQSQIESLGDPTRALLQIKEKRCVQKILLDLPEFMEHIKDRKGLPLPQHIESSFDEIIKFMEL